VASELRGASMANYFALRQEKRQHQQQKQQQQQRQRNNGDSGSSISRRNKSKIGRIRTAANLAA